MSQHPYEYTQELLESYLDLRERWHSGTMVPAQVEIHVPPGGMKRCWLNCSHCYTRGGLIHGETIEAERLVDLVGQIAAGSPRSGDVPRKIVLSGVETDPLNSDAIDAVVTAVKEGRLALGIHTKGLKLAPALIAPLVARNTTADYITFSIDAGSALTYDRVHGIDGKRTALYEIVKRNIRQLLIQRNETGSPLKVRVTYLITGQNSTLDEITGFIDDFTDIEVDSLRFSVPIIPRMARRDESGRFPQVSPAQLAMIERAVAGRQTHDDRIVYQQFDANTRRTLPCFTRWLMPAIGYDGHLYPCCLVATAEFKSLRIGDLKVNDFWPAYYSDRDLPYVAANCQCDRKAMEINRNVLQLVSASRLPTARLAPLSESR